MKINHKFEHVDGAMDTDTDKLTCVPIPNHCEVNLCVKANMHIPIAQIKLYSSELKVDFDATIEDAVKLGQQIAHRWNKYQELKTKIEILQLLLSECFEEAIAPLGAGITVRPDAKSEDVANRVFKMIQEFKPINVEIKQDFEEKFTRSF